MSDRYNTNSKVTNYSDFCNNWESEKEKLKSAKRSFTPNSDRQNFVRNSRTEYNPITHKLTDYTEEEIDDMLNKMEDSEEANEGVFLGGYSKEDQPSIIDDIERDLMEMSSEEGTEYLDYIISFCQEKINHL